MLLSLASFVMSPRSSSGCDSSLCIFFIYFPSATSSNNIRVDGTSYRTRFVSAWLKKVVGSVTLFAKLLKADYAVSSHCVLCRKAGSSQSLSRRPHHQSSPPAKSSWTVQVHSRVWCGKRCPAFSCRPFHQSRSRPIRPFIPFSTFICLLSQTKCYNILKISQINSAREISW